MRRDVVGYLLFSVLASAAMNLISGCSNRAPVDPSTSSLDPSMTRPAITPSSAYLLPGQTIQFNATLNGASLSNPMWLVNNVSGGNAASGTISATGLYTAPSGSSLASVLVSVTDPAHKTTSAPTMISLFHPGQLPAGIVSPSNNSLVALYTMFLPQGTSAQVRFGTSTNYGLTTWSQTAPQGGGFVSIYVAGMRATSTYHMQAAIQLPDGSQITDTDHTFTTGAISGSLFPSITAQLTGTGTPSPGVELLSYFQATTQDLTCVFATDLAGNVIWFYPLPAGASTDPVKLLPNGHMLVVTAGTVNDVREVDLAGNMFTQITAAQVNSIPSLQNVVWGGFNHDVLPLPNGHLILLASIQESVSNVPGVADGTAVLGNVLIDWDPQQSAPVWTWSTFDHLDLTRAPYGIADWTHGNAVIYSPDDRDLILSLRNQNWLLKINYNDGAGDGSILWRFGPGGDFTLATEPIDWNYGQHYPTIESPNSSGIFDLMVFDNGNGRLVDANNDVCGTPGSPACYSSVPIYQLNETTKTATVQWEYNLSHAYSFCCGDALVLPNGNIEFDVAADQNFTFGVSYIEEVTQTSSPELVWRMDVQGSPANFDLVYRGIRIPSLYPGVTWTQSAMQTANSNSALLPQR